MRPHAKRSRLCREHLPNRRRAHPEPAPTRRPPSRGHHPRPSRPARVPRHLRRHGPRPHHLRYAEYAEHGLTHPDLTREHVHAIHTELSTGPARLSAPNLNALYLLALHPSTPHDQRAELIARAEASRASAPPSNAALAAAAHTVTNDTALHLPLSTLRALARHPSGKTTSAHLATALSTYDLTTHHVRIIAALEPTFPGTAHDLITTARTLHT